MKHYFELKNIQIPYMNKQEQNHRKHLSLNQTNKWKKIFKPPINLSEERKWLLAVTSFELTNSVFLYNCGKQLFCN